MYIVVNAILSAEHYDAKYGDHVDETVINIKSITGVIS